MSERAPLRVVASGDGAAAKRTRRSPKAAENAARRAAKAVGVPTMTLLYEQGGKMVIATWPPSNSLAKGSVCDAYCVLFPQDAENLPR